MKANWVNMTNAVFRATLNVMFSIVRLIIGLASEVLLGVVQMALDIIAAIISLLVFLILILWLFTL